MGFFEFQCVPDIVAPPPRKIYVEKKIPKNGPRYMKFILNALDKCPESVADELAAELRARVPLTEDPRRIQVLDSIVTGVRKTLTSGNIPQATKKLLATQVLSENVVRQERLVSAAAQELKLSRAFIKKYSGLETAPNRKVSVNLY